MQRPAKKLTAKEAAAMFDSAQSGEFLNEWQIESRQVVARLDKQERLADQAERSLDASAAGFRTWRQYKECANHCSMVCDYFQTNANFKRLWTLLKKEDAEDDFHRPYGSFGPYRMCVPASIIRAVEAWHQAPKITARERREYAKSLVNACDKLTEHLAVISPGGLQEHGLASLTPTAEQGRQLAAAFRSSKALKNEIGANDFAARSLASSALESAGISYAWAIDQLRQEAMKWVALDTVLPTKVRAAGAMKTYFISALDQIMETRWARDPKALGAQFCADLVSLLANTDCSADDVRKSREMARGAA